MEDKKTLLAKMYFDELLKEKKDLNKLAKYEQQIMDDADFGDVEIIKNDESIVINHVFVLSKRLPIMISKFPSNRAVYYAKYSNYKEMKKQRKNYRKENKEEDLLFKLSEIEQTYDVLYDKFLKYCTDDNETVDKIKSIVGDVYSMIAFYYLPNEEEKPKFEELLKRAEKRNITINNLEHCELASKEMRQQAAKNALIIKKKQAIAEILNFDIETVSFDVIDKYTFDEQITLGRCIDPSIDKDYAIALFKSEIEDLNDISDEIKKLLNSDDAEIKIKMVNVPYRTISFSSTPAEYYWKVAWRDHNDNWYRREGDYSYGGGNVGRLSSCPAKYMYESFIETSNFRNRPCKGITENKGDNYVMPSNSAPSIPDDLLVRDNDARQSLINDLKARKAYAESGIGLNWVFQRTVDPTYQYNIEELIFFPIYSIWIKKDNYVAYGYVDASSPGNVSILEIIELKGEEDFQLYVSKIRKQEAYELKEVEEVKTKSSVSISLVVIMIITLITSLITFITNISGGFRNILFLIPAIVSVILPKSFKSKTGKIISTVLMIILLIVAIFFFYVGVIE